MSFVQFTSVTGDSEVVFTRVHGLGNTGVCSIGSDNHVNLHLGGGSSGLSGFEQLVVKSVLRFGSLVVGRNIDSGDETVDRFGSVFDGAVSEVLVRDFTTAHANIFIRLQSISDGDFGSSGRDKIHASDLAIDDSLRDVKFTDHAKRDGTSTWLSVVYLTFEHDGVNSTLLGEDFGSTGSRWTSSDDSDLVLHVHVGSVRSDGILGNRSLSEGRRAGCKRTGGSGESRETLTTQTQFVSSDVSFNVFLFCWSFSISPRA